MEFVSFNSDYDIQHSDLVERINQHFNIREGKPVINESEIYEITSNFKIVFIVQDDAVSDKFESYRYIGLSLSESIEENENGDKYLKLREYLYPLIRVDGLFSINTDITIMPNFQIQYYMRCNEALHKWKSGNITFMEACSDLNMKRVLR